jgi:NADP-dependent 3-hydroxy acid dehydrogenase YdfG
LIIYIIHLETDLTDEKSILASISLIKQKYQTFDALINCAGIMSIQEANAISYDELETLMKINTLAPIFLTSQLFDLIKTNKADILNVGSTVGTKAYPSQEAYGASKRALRGISQNLQLELAETKCRVIQFNP